MSVRNSIAEKFQTAVNKCDICYSQYDRYDRQPVIICTMHHTICRECLKGQQSRGICPFCRQKINFGKVVVNNYIFELLPNNPPPPNTRVQVNPFPINPSRPIDPINPIIAPPQSINRLPAQHIYDPSYHPPEQAHDYNRYNFVPNDIDAYINDAEAFNNNDGIWQGIKNRLGFHLQSERQGIYITIFIMQLPFVFFDLLFALTGEDAQCYDTPHVSRAYVLRPWLLAMGITGLSCMFILFVFGAMRVCTLINVSCLRKVELVAMGILVVKVLLWLYMELMLFANVIGPYCNGGIYAYGLILTIIHCIILLILFCCSTCGR